MIKRKDYLSLHLEPKKGRRFNNGGLILVDPPQEIVSLDIREKLCKSMVLDIESSDLIDSRLDVTLDTRPSQIFRIDKCKTRII